HQASVRGVVIVAIQKREQLYLHVVEARADVDVIEAALAQGPPEALHFSAGARVVRLGVDQFDVQARTRGREDLAAVGRAVVEVQRSRPTVGTQGCDEDLEHVDLALARAGVEHRHKARRIVEEAVDSQRDLFLAVLADEHGTMADVGVPQVTGLFGLPAPTLAVGRAATRATLTAEAVRDEQPTDRGGLDCAGLDAAFGAQRAQDQRHRGAGPLTANLEDQFALRLGQRLRVTGRARLGSQRFEAAFAVVPQPALERRHRKGPRDLGARWPVATFAELAQQRRLLAAVELRARQRAEHLRPKQRDAFGVVLGFEGVVGIGHASSVSRLLTLWEGAAMV